MKKLLFVIFLSIQFLSQIMGQVTWTVTCPTCTNFPANDTVCSGQQLVINYSVYSSYSSAVTFTVQSVITHPSPSTQTMTITTIQPSSIYTNTYTIPAPSSLGLHQVLVQIITYNAQATNSADDQTIQVKLPPNTPTVTASSSTVLCPNSSVILNSSSVTGNAWSTTATTQSITVNSAGSYFVTNTNLCGSTNSNTVSVTVSTTPTVDVNSGAVCAGMNYTLAPTGANTYTYSSGSAVVTPTANTSYTVTGTDTNGCVSGQAIANVTVNAFPSLTVTVLSPTVCTGTLDTLVVHGASTYTWSTGYIGQQFHPTLTATTHYTVTGTNTHGCQNSDTATVTVYNCSTTGIQQINDGKFSVYPNPAKDCIYLNNIKSNTSVDVFDLSGQSIKHIQNVYGSIDISELVKGMYFLQVSSQQTTETLKIIKE